jgi:polyhydroxyalkanoate synthase
MTAAQASPKSALLAEVAEILDKAAFATIGRVTFGLSPATLVQAYSDWWLHLSCSPGKRLQLAAEGLSNMARLSSYAARSAVNADTAPAIEPPAQDHRFQDPAWKRPPFSLAAQAFLLGEQWWSAATTGVAGVTRHHQDMVAFGTRQLLDTVAPSNFIASNPVVQDKIVETRGHCLIEGAKHLLDDMQHMGRGAPPAGAERFTVGDVVATTRGKVVLRNTLIELIQYEPTTPAVRPEPVLITPAWIMKYYILDLSPENSLIRWLVGQGYTVFCISWRNPGEADRDLDLEDYRRLGPIAALDAITAITGASKVHGVGYCLGGTLLSIAAAAMARDQDRRLASVTLFAAQTEFSEPGELGLFIDEAQLNLLDDMMWTQGYLDGAQMGGAFQMLRSNDLIWSRLLTTYLMGEREPMSDLMAWNADGTRLPYAMHSQYLRELFLQGDLAEGRFKAGGRPITLSALRAPMFVVGTERDHVAPWRSVYKIHWLSSAEICFVLASGGHNAGIVSEPGHPHRSYRSLTREADGSALDPDAWLARASLQQGSWWIAWAAWLAHHSGPQVAPPPMGAPDAGYKPLGDAPGLYVRER